MYIYIYMYMCIYILYMHIISKEVSMYYSISFKELSQSNLDYPWTGLTGPEI